MKKEQCQITILPDDRVLSATAGDSLYTLLLVAGVVSAETPLSERLRLEKGSVGPALNPATEAAVFSPSDLAEGWLLASERQIVGDAVLLRYEAAAAAEAEEASPDNQPLLAGQGYAMVFDLGDSTIAGGLVGLENLRIPLLTACPNAQYSVAVEVRQRLALARKDPAVKERLTELLHRDIDTLTEKLTARAGIEKQEIRVVTMAASRAMDSLLLGLLPEDKPVSHYVEKHTAADLGLQAIPGEVEVWLLPAINQELGADTVAAALAADLWHKRKSEKVTLLLDLAMNGVLLAAGKGRLIACATPELPFEGAGITCGMPAVTGAITDVAIDDIVTIKTVHDGHPRGVCGAGFLAALAVMSEQGMIDREGRLVQPEDLPERVASRFRSTAAGREFVLSPADDYYSRDICINQEDVLQLQLAKGAIFAACRAALYALGAEESEISEILLAESYRANISPTAVHKLGLLPDTSPEQVLAIGNASWQGAFLAISARKFLAEAEDLSRTIEQLDLASDKTYALAFIHGMDF